MSSIRVMVVDNHELLLEGVSAVLEREDDIAVVAQSTTGGEAVEEYRRLTPDVVIMAMGLPDMTGIMASKRIINHDNNAKIILLSMNTARGQVISSMNAGVYGYLLKDATSNELLHAVRCVSGGEKYYTGKVLDVEVISVVNETSDSDSDRNGLTARQAEILCLIAHGKCTRQIASDLGISVHTVATHRRLLMDKLKIYEPVGLARHAMKCGYVRIEK